MTRYRVNLTLLDVVVLRNTAICYKLHLCVSFEFHNEIEGLVSLIDLDCILCDVRTESYVHFR